MMTSMKLNSSSPASTTTSSTPTSSSSSSSSWTPNDPHVVSTSPRNDPARGTAAIVGTAANNLLISAAIGAMGAAAIAALSSFWIASWSRRRLVEEGKGDGGETALLLRTLSEISRRLEKLEGGDGRGRGSRGSHCRRGRSGSGSGSGSGGRDRGRKKDSDSDEGDASDHQDDAASAQSHGDNSVVKAAGSEAMGDGSNFANSSNVIDSDGNSHTIHSNLRSGNCDNRRRNQRSVRGMGLSQSMNAGAQLRSAVVQASGQNAATRPRRVSHAPDRGSPRVRAHNAKSLLASTCATDHAVILDAADDDVPDDISYTPHAPPQTILTKHRPPSHLEMAIPRHAQRPHADIAALPDLPDCDASHGHTHPTATSASSSTHASHPLSEPVPVVLVSDPGQDLDDEMMFIMARHLASLDLLSLKGVVANLAPSFARARLTRGTLDLLGLHRVPVGIGTDGGDLAGKHSSDQFEHTASSYIVQEDGEAARGLESGMRLLQRLYDEASDVEYVEMWDDDDEEGERVIVGVGEMEDGDEKEEAEDNRHSHHQPHRRRPDQPHDKQHNDHGGIPGVNIHQKMKRKSSSDSAKKTKDNPNSNSNSKPERKTKMVPRGGLVLVITSSLKDAAIFARDNPSLFAAKTREVVIMGGCKPIPSLDDTTAAAAIAASSLNDGDYLDDFDDQTPNANAQAAATLHNEYVNAKLSKFECEPDSAHNNTFDTAASAFFYSQCQKMNVTLTVVSRFAAYAAKMPRSVYDDLALTGSSIGWRLRNSQRASIDQLWQRACSTDPAVRKGLPPRCDRRWFIDTFCGGDDDEARCCEDTAWDLVTGFMQYDTIALLAAIPKVREKYFAPLVLPPFQAEKKEKTTDGARKRGSKGSKTGGKQSKSKDPSATGDLAPEIQRMSESPGGRILFSRRSSDPGPGFLQRALAQANIDNRELETRKNTLPPLEFPTSRPPIPFERGTRNLIGVSDKEHNLKDPTSLIRLLETGYRAGILCNHHTQPHLILCLQLRWDNLADTLLTCLMLRSLWDMRLASVLGVVVSIYPSEAESPKDDGTDWSEDEKSDDDDQTAKAAGNAANANGQTCGPAPSNTSESSPKQSPSTLRALAESIRDTLRSIGLSHVKLLIVSGKTMQEHKATAAEALLELYEAAPPIGVSLVLTATFTSVWPFAESYPELFRDKTVRVVHTGGALVWPARWGWGSLPFSNSKDDQTYSSGDLSGELTEEKVLVPDPAAQNHRLDLSSARQFYKRVQALSVPMVILSRHVAKECCIPRHFFDVLGSHGGLVGKRICDSERNSLLNLWRCACAPMGSAARGNLPERCDAQWFADTFCAGREAKTEDDVWNYVEAVNLYSPIALLASLPGETLKSYFQTMPFTVRSATHHVIGLTEEVPPRNVRNPSELRSLVVQCFLSAALANESEFTKEPPPKVPIRMNHEQRSRVYNSRDSVLGNSVHSHISTESNNMDDEDMWTFSEQARRELFNRTVVRTSKNLVMPKEKKRTFVSSTNNRDVLGFIPPQPLSNDNDTSSDEEGL